MLAKLKKSSTYSIQGKLAMPIKVSTVYMYSFNQMIAIMGILFYPKN